MKSVLFAATEAVPFVKTGGLGEVIGSLPRELRRQGIDARVIIPCYEDIPSEYRRQFTFLTSFEVTVGWRKQYCGILYYE